VTDDPFDYEVYALGADPLPRPQRLGARVLDGSRSLSDDQILEPVLVHVFSINALGGASRVVKAGNRI
jgi:hypothetical protein